MNTKLTTIMLLGIAGLGLGTSNASASDLSRFLENSRINVAYGGGRGYSNYYGGYAPRYGSQYFPQYGPQYGGYSQIPPNGYFPAQPNFLPPAPAPYFDGPVGIGYGYDGQVPSPQWQGGGYYGHGDRYCHHQHGGNWDRGF